MAKKVTVQLQTVGADSAVKDIEKVKLAKETKYTPGPDDFMANLPKQPGPTVENDPIIKEDITKYDESGKAILNEPAKIKNK